MSCLFSSQIIGKVIDNWKVIGSQTIIMFGSLHLFFFRQPPRRRQIRQAASCAAQAQKVQKAQDLAPQGQRQRGWPGPQSPLVQQAREGAAQAGPPLTQEGPGLQPVLPALGQPRQCQGQGPFSLLLHNNHSQNRVINHSPIIRFNWQSLAITSWSSDDRQFGFYSIRARRLGTTGTNLTILCKK